MNEWLVVPNAHENGQYLDVYVQILQYALMSGKIGRYRMTFQENIIRITICV